MVKQRCWMWKFDYENVKVDVLVGLCAGMNKKEL